MSYVYIPEPQIISYKLNTASNNRLFAGQGHMTKSNHKSIIKKVVVQNGCQKWKEHNEISKVANFETTVG